MQKVMFKTINDSFMETFIVFCCILMQKQRETDNADHYEVAAGCTF